MYTKATEIHVYQKPRISHAYASSELARNRAALCGVFNYTNIGSVDDVSADIMRYGRNQITRVTATFNGNRPIMIMHIMHISRLCVDNISELLLQNFYSTILAYFVIFNVYTESNGMTFLKRRFSHWNISFILPKIFLYLVMFTFSTFKGRAVKYL